MPNRLARETSPYLQQHAANPVDWYAWGDEALARARREDRPILLSIGYSACHWCHVMAHESFEDAEVAAVMNRLFVNIKVDREERPDLDQIYQLAQQMLVQRPGGWPLTMFLAPDGTPFFGGTYFPKTARYGLPGFVELIEQVAEVWKAQREQIGQQSEQLRIAFSRLLPRPGTHRAALDDVPLGATLEALRASFDARDGGFGGAPKFPHPTELELCLRSHALRADYDALRMADTTLTRMCEGGIFDQLGGGFCRYSVDAQWTIPHFEKMLYDNGPLLGLLADAWLATGNNLYERCAAQTAEWMMREMQSPEGGYYSSLDADSEHEEGKYYVWERDEARALLDAEEWRIAAPVFGLEQSANFEGRHWHLRIATPLTQAAAQAQMSPERAAQRLASARTKLFAARERRVRPARDEKILVSWNALAIRGMARAARVFGRPEWLSSARRALEFVRRAMWRDDRLLATYKDGRAHLSAYLDDYAYLSAALLELLQAEFSSAELRFVLSLADVLLEQFEDRDAGGFFFTAHDHERLLHRPKPAHDTSMASGNGVAAFVLQRLAALSGEERYARAARRTLELFYPGMCERPGGFAMLVLALDEALAPPASVVLRGGEPALERWRTELARELLPDTMVLAIADGVADLPPPLDKPARTGAVNAWLCRGVTCLEPISELETLKRACKQPAVR